MIDLAGPWVCHLLVVILTGYLFSRIAHSRIEAILTAWVAGLIAIAAFGSLQLHEGGWIAAHLYWRLASRSFRRRGFRKFPWRVAGVLSFCWTLPLVAAWLVVRWRWRARELN